MSKSLWQLQAEGKVVTSVDSSDLLYLLRDPSVGRFDRVITAGNLSASVAGIHNHDDRYYTETETGILLAGYAPAVHDHDTRYYTEAEVNALVAATSAMPIGSVQDYSGAVAPDATWLLMTGQTVVNAQTLYPVLWGRIPVAWQSGSSMILPNARGKVSVGLDTGDSSFDAIGEVGGAKTHQLITSEMPNHQHTASPHQHTIPHHSHAVGGVSGGSGSHLHNMVPASSGRGSGLAMAHTGTSGPYILYQWNDTPPTTDTMANHTHSMPANTGFDGGTGLTSNVGSGTDLIGGGGSHNNLQPYVVFNKMIKVL